MGFFDNMVDNATKASNATTEATATVTDDTTISFDTSDVIVTDESNAISFTDMTEAELPNTV